MKTLILVFTTLIASSLLASPPGAKLGPYDEKADWKSDWFIESQLEMSLDTEGYNFPVSIQFVPNPGPGPKDPLYFVIEIRGVIKVVTNDRTVYEFAKDFFELKPEKELPDVQGEIGLTGLCLDPQKGYVFTTFTYQDENKRMRSAFARFHSKPQKFSLKPDKVVVFKDLFAEDEPAVSHMIGPCMVYKDHLYINVGDGEKPYEARNLNSTLGKILRVNRDGTPPRDNPFYTKDGENTPKDYIWAYGFRNAFGLKEIDGNIFISENGPSVDRVRQVEKGIDGNWDGSDWSISVNSLITFGPTISPVQIDYLDSRAPFEVPAKYNRSLLIAAAGSGSGFNPAGIVVLPMDGKKSQATGAGRYILRYRGKSYQNVAGVAIGPDGVYVLPIYPLANGKTAIIKMTFHGEREWTPVIPSDDAFLLMQHYGCLGCHQVFSMGSKIAPELTPNVLKKRLEKRLFSPDYLELLDQIDHIKGEPFESFKEAREDVRKSEGIERLQKWVQYRIMQPRFDTPASAMPFLKVPENHAKFMASFLIRKRTFWDKIRDRIFGRSFDWKFVAASFVGGGVCALLLMGVCSFLRRR